MRTTITKLVAICLIVCPSASYADSSYQQISQFSGGQLIDSLKNVPFITKQIKTLTEPTSIITMVHGNQKAVVSRESTDITDLDRQVIIHIDKEKKTYSVLTFAEFDKLMQQMPQKITQMQQQLKDAQAKSQSQMPPSNLQYKFTTTVTDPGPSKVINGKDAVQQVVTMKMVISDPDHPGTDIIYTMTTEVWTTPEIPAEMKDVQDFDLRLAKQLMAGVDLSALKNMAGISQASMSMMFGSKPGSAEAFAQMQKELAKIKGTRILEITRMGGSGTGMAAPTSGTTGLATPSLPTDGSVVRQVATDTAAQTASGEAARFGIPGAALGNSIMGALHRKKATPPPPVPTPAPTAGSTAQAPGDVTLMQMTEQTTDFSHEAIPSSVFVVPAGFKQVPSPMVQAMAK